MRIVLATASERRHELFRVLRLEFSIAESGFDETEIMAKGLSPRETVEAIAEAKLRSIMHKHEDALVITADTVVCLDGRILGKPDGDNGAYDMLRSLSGKTHEVYTGIAYSRLSEIVVLSESASVKIRNLSDAEIKEYIATGEAQGKAGAYNVGGLGAVIVESISGGIDTVMGLPVGLVRRELCRMKIIGFEGR